MKLKELLLTALLCILSAACGDDVPSPGGGNADGGSDGKDNPDVITPNPDTPEKYVLLIGSDVSWGTQLEAQGYQFYSWNHRDAMQSIESQVDMGAEAIRLRVYMDPKDDYCSTLDVVQKAKRCTALGVPVLLDICYADSIPLSNRHDKPSRWADYSYDMLSMEVYDYTRDLLQTMKLEEIDIRWVEIGHETRCGMLWPEGNAENHASQYKNLFHRAATAVRSIYPDASIIATMGDAYDQAQVYKGLQLLNKSDYDIVGLHLYPTASIGQSYKTVAGGQTCTISRATDAIASASQCIDVIYDKFGKHCILTEVGEPADKETASTQVMNNLKLTMKQNSSCDAAFYMEPESFTGWLGYTQGASLLSGKAVKPTTIWP